MVFEEMTLVTPFWTVSFRLDECIEVRLDEEGGPCANAEIAEGVLTQFPGSGMTKT